MATAVPGQTLQFQSFQSLIGRDVLHMHGCERTATTGHATCKRQEWPFCARLYEREIRRHIRGSGRESERERVDRFESVLPEGSHISFA